MNKNILKFGIVLASSLALVACGNFKGDTPTEETKTTQSSTEKKVDVKEAVEKDADTLLTAVLTRSNTGFTKLYGKTYEKWSDPIIAVATQEYIDENGLTPESKYTMEYLTDYGRVTPTEVAKGFYETRRDMIKDIKDFEITDVQVDEEKGSAEVTYSSRSINSTAASNVVTNLLLTIFQGNVDVLQKLNQTSSTDEEVNKVKGLVTFYLFSNNFSGNFLGYNDVPTEFSYTPLTTEVYEKTITLTKDEDDNWVISDEDYRSMISDLMNQDEKADDVYYHQRQTAS